MLIKKKIQLAKTQGLVKLIFFMIMRYFYVKFI